MLILRLYYKEYKTRQGHTSCLYKSWVESAPLGVGADADPSLCNKKHVVVSSCTDHTLTLLLGYTTLYYNDIIYAICDRYIVRPPLK